MLKPMPRKTNRQRSEKIYNDFVLKFGYPSRIHHDQGGEFENQLVGCLEKFCGIRHSRTHHITHRGTGKSSVSTKHFSECFVHFQNKRNLDGVITSVKLYMHIIARDILLQNQLQDAEVVPVTQNTLVVGIQQ